MSETNQRVVEQYAAATSHLIEDFMRAFVANPAVMQHIQALISSGAAFELKTTVKPDALPRVEISVAAENGPAVYLGRLEFERPVTH